MSSETEKGDYYWMLPIRAPWNLKDVAAVHFLRLIIGILLVRYVFPLLFTASAFWIELTDRVIILGLVWFAVRKYREKLTDWGLSTDNMLKNVLWGLIAGVILLTVSVYSERIYSSVFFQTRMQHPLVAQVEEAVSWYQLITPVFLAGVAAPVTEEILYRLLTFVPLKDRLGLWAGALASSLIFALFHFNLYWLAEMVIVGVGLALVYYWTGSLISSIFAHSFINTAKIMMLFLNLPVY